MDPVRAWGLKCYYTGGVEGFHTQTSALGDAQGQQKIVFYDVLIGTSIQ